MRNKDKKQRKGQETAIGKIIYSFLLFMPLLAIGFTCLYAVFNKNAYKSYYGETINEVEQHEGYNSLEEEYYYQFGLAQVNTNYIQYDVSNVKYVSGNYTFQQDVSNFKQIYVYYSNNIHYTRITYTDNTQQYIQNLSSTFSDYVLSFNLISKPTNNAFEDFIYYKTFNKDSFVSEVFYYSVDRVTQSNLFNWAQNSVIYTTTNATCNALSITTPFIPLLMSYWLIISVIYFLYDIALMLVWLIHRKIHELQESL